jgi:hypothetical protein
MLMEQLDYNLLFRLFVGLAMDEAVWNHAVFSKNRRKDGEGAGPQSGDGEVDLHGEKRGNQTHVSTTDRQARLYRKSKDSEDKISYLGSR